MGEIINVDYVDEGEIVAALKKSNLTAYGDPGQMLPLEQAIWVLAVSKDKAKVAKLTAKAISSILVELAELEVKPLAITRAFARAKNKVKTHKEDHDVYYEVLRPGRGLLGNKAIFDVDVNYFSGANAWSDLNINFPVIVGKLNGDLCIVDPYFGNGTFIALSHFGKQRTIRFLTSQLGKQEQQDRSAFDINLKRFTKEFKNISIKQYPNIYELHDRYIITNDGLVVMGNGLKDFANKESFLIYLPIKLLKGVMPILKSKFNKKWSISNKLG